MKICASDPQIAAVLRQLNLVSISGVTADLRSWRVIIMRSRGEYLDSVEAPDREGPRP